MTSSVLSPATVPMMSAFFCTSMNSPTVCAAPGMVRTTISSSLLSMPTTSAPMIGRIAELPGSEGIA